MNLSTLFKVVDTLLAVREVRKEGSAPDELRDTGPSEAPRGGIADRIETQLANVVVVALKEAFDRDHARFELERANLEDQKRRAEEAARLELQRQIVDREIGRLRLLAGMALAGWVTSLALYVTRLGVASIASRSLLAIGWLLLLASIALSFSSQAKAATARFSDPVRENASTNTSLWVLTAGLACCAGSVLV